MLKVYGGIRSNIIDNVKSMEEQTVNTDTGKPRVSPGPAPAYDKADFQHTPISRT